MLKSHASYPFLAIIVTLLLPFLPLHADSNAAYTPDAGFSPEAAYPPNAPYPPNPYFSQPGQIGSKLSPAFTDANAAAMHFINLLDNQAYGGAWADSSRLMQDVVARQIWVEGVRGLRQNMGVVKARTISSHQQVKRLPGGTTGVFMIINFATEFSYQPNVIESVTMTMEGTLGQWRVLSYRLGNP